MTFSIEEFKPLIETKIQELLSLVADNFGLILGEDDLKCWLFKKLYEIPKFSRFDCTRDGKYKASYIHTEIAWFDSDNKLKIIPDISIIDPKDLYMSEQPLIKLPSKGILSILGHSIIFELKFCKNKNGITKYFFENQIQKDFNKIHRLKTKHESQGATNSIFCYFIILNKAKNTCKEFKEFIKTNEEGEYFKIIYKSMDFEF